MIASLVKPFVSVCQMGRNTVNFTDGATSDAAFQSHDGQAIFSFRAGGVRMSWWR